MSDIQNALDQILTFCDEYSEIQSLLLTYLDTSDNNQDTNSQNLSNLIQELKKKKIEDDRSSLDDFLRMLVHIASNHHRSIDFFPKIANLLVSLKTEIQKYYSNEDLFNLFSHAEPVIVLLKDNLFQFTNEVNTIINSKDNQDLKQYYYPDDKKNEIENQKTGENHNQICTLIRLDEAPNFIDLVSHENISLEAKIDPSPFETNDFLKKHSEVTLLQYAAFCGSVAVFNHISNAKPELLESDIWEYAIHGRNYEIINTLKEKTVSAPNDNYESCLNLSISSHHSELIRTIQDDLANPPENAEEEEEEKNDQSVSPKYVLDPHLKTAIISHNYIEVASKLSSIKDEKDGILQIFRKSNLYSDVPVRGINELFQVAAKYGFNKIVEILIKLPCININYCGKYTALQKACRIGDYSLAELLLKIDNIDINRKSIPHVSDINKDFDGLTALGIAVRYHNNSIVKLLLQQPNIDINQRSQWISNTPLIAAAIYGNTEAATLLLKRENIDLNHQSNDRYSIQQNKVIAGGESALHSACLYNHPEITKLLLSTSGIDVNLENWEGKKAFDCTEDPEIKALFSNH